MLKRKNIDTKMVMFSLLGMLIMNLAVGPLFPGSMANAAGGIPVQQGVQSLVTPENVSAMLKSGTVKLIDVRPPEHYRAEHLPGAVNTWWSDYQDTNGLVPSPEHLAALLSKLGINNQDTIVLYADADKHGPAYVAHFWWLLDMFGYQNVKILDGGLEAWRVAGYSLTDEVSQVPTGNFQVKRIDTAKLATTEEVWHAVNEHDPNVIILDVREWGEFTGDVQAPGAARKGRIPGAVWLYWGDVLNPDKTLKNTDALQKIFAEKGITRDKVIITYCQAGVRAAHTAYVLNELLGYKNVKNYAGSWSVWSQRGDLPIESDS
ncbi:sulfurtransferase [Sporomusa aerivorans]|uniref:sulfurtransferase n=1 Tax=Sporomusa aerivorans TaxID=204936 RepID=UPI00352AC0B4